ncbi:hypothetical protein AB7C87_13730 [Natrarchaeobius sp. A-rgal3]|uniref:Uncharacterized protein n=1 Tax=Natrialba swarupiae TaxID=2448032 RepID=A0A5D5AVQ7_9EURY|nr:hypothetical protein [Natrialba swarupiae]MCW8173144.1 hypothetical protein [Natrialba swarupiae]TYT63211.1 hypothetical protein FYC77_03820 [Natrialba swarupiae]
MSDEKTSIRIFVAVSTSFRSVVSEPLLRAVETVSVLPIVVLAGVAVFQVVYSDPDPQAGLVFAAVIIVWPFLSSVIVLLLGCVSLIRYVHDFTVSKLLVALLCFHTILALYVIFMFSAGFAIGESESGVLVPLGLVIGSSIAFTVCVLLQAARTIVSGCASFIRS